MMASRVTPPAAEVEGAKEEGGTVEATRLVVSTRGYFGRSKLDLTPLDRDSVDGTCCEILKYSQVYEPYRSIVGQEQGRTHGDLNECRKIKSNLNQINPNLV